MDRDGKLTIERFLEFQSQLQREILTLEFNRKGPDAETGKISEKQFAELLLAYAEYSTKKRSAVLKRVKRAYGLGKNGNGKNGGANGNGKNGHKGSEGEPPPPPPPSHKPSLGISLEDYIRIFYLLMHIEDVDKVKLRRIKLIKRSLSTLRVIRSIMQALYFYNLAGASIDQRTLKHVSKVCADVDLSDHVVDVIFTIFDEDGDGGLSNKEFIDVMKNKLKRGLEKPKDTGLMNLLAAVTKCAGESATASAKAFKQHHHKQ